MNRLPIRSATARIPAMNQLPIPSVSPTTAVVVVYSA